MSSFKNSPRRSPAAATSGKAIVSLVLGILSFCLPCVAGIPGLALGYFGLKDINESGGRLAGKGLAIAGMLCSVFGSLCGSVFIGGGIYGFQQVRLSAQRIGSSNDLKQIGLALQTYADVMNGTFPPAVLRRDPLTGRPCQPYSWRVALLPYIEQANLLRMYHFNEPWDSASNNKVLDTMPKIYALPAAGAKAPPNETYYQMFVGKSTVGEGGGGHGLTLSQITNAHGTAGTLLVVEAAESVPWTKPEDLSYAVDRPLPRLGGHFGRVFLGLFCDATLEAIPQDVDEKTLRALITYDDPDHNARSRLHGPR